ncbi:MAG: acetylornithine transaminase [Verrucomicrobiota bacterium]|nr:acetylornithine transaminase [Limisphaera sp.]MDW8380961.1 acetylornithine transaminase [Verrucomicrobiota bacterium]
METSGVEVPGALVKQLKTAGEDVRALFDRYVLPTYARMGVVFTHGVGNYLFDDGGRRYLDLGGGIAVNVLGHSHPAIIEALTQQARRLIHCSNYYYTELQAVLARELVRLIGPGKMFFCNSGAEANEGLFKLARRFGHPEGRFEILTATHSFHGRTLAGISATGQDKVKLGFDPLVPGFRHVPFNDLHAVREALSPATVAILIEGVQGEGGVHVARPEYLVGLRRLCDEKRLLLLMDEVQCGCYRTGRFTSWQRILEGSLEAAEFLPDGVAMAKSLGGGFPIGAFWVREAHTALLGPGSHGTTFGGTPLACATALAVLHTIEAEGLADRARKLGQWLLVELNHLVSRYPSVLREARGLGLMLGLQLQAEVAGLSNKNGLSPASQLAERLLQAGLLVIPAGTHVIRLLPALTLTEDEAREGLEKLQAVLAALV